MHVLKHGFMPFLFDICGGGSLVSELDLLRQQRDEMNQRIADLEAADKASLIEQVRELMAKGGLTVSDILGDTKKAKAAATPKGAPKYLNTATGESWGGRGAKPKWLVEAVAQGATLESFANPAS
jgi:DNA-binding protein H-NS